MRLFAVTALLAICLTSSVALAQLGNVKAVDKSPKQPENPIMGILTQPNVHHWERPCPSYVQTTYVEWLAQVGVRAIPLFYDEPSWAAQVAMMDQLNGVLFTGGMQNSTIDSPFYRRVLKIVQYAMERNEAGDPFVLWGTCQGFQLIAMAVGKDQSILHCDYTGLMTSMEHLDMVQPIANSSRWLSLINTTGVPPTVYQDMVAIKTTANGRNCGIEPKFFEENEQLKKNFNVLATNVDVAGKPAVSTFEHKKYEIYAVQWHPEGSQYWYDMGFDKAPATIRVSQYHATLLANRLRRNKRSFSTPTEAAKHMITQYEIGRKPAMEYSGFYCFNVPRIQDVEAELQLWWGIGVGAGVLLVSTWAYMYMQSQKV